MKRLIKFSENFIKFFLLIFIIGIGLVNIMKVSIDNSNIFYYSFLLIIFTFIIIWLYRSDIINKKHFNIIIFLYFIVGIIIRVYLIQGLSFNLDSDFKLYYTTAKEIMNGAKSSSAYYLSFNGYVYFFATFLAVIFKIFGAKIAVALGANLVFSLVSCIFLYKTISLKAKKETSLFLTSAYFLLPTIIFSNLLVSTETLFMMFFMMAIYVYYRIIDNKQYTKFTFKNIISLVLFGVLISITNNIRPVMTIFIIALVICYILKSKKSRELFFLLIIILSYYLCNLGINSYIENGIKTSTRSGALGWSIYFGSNYNSCGGWTEKDAAYVFKILDDKSKGDKELIIDSAERLKDYGAVKSAKLMACKYKHLWQDSNGTYGFVRHLVNNDNSSININEYETPLAKISSILVVLMCVGAAYGVIVEIKEKTNKWLFVELFSLGYILSNLLVCLNGRYSLLLFPLLLICCSIFLDRVFTFDKGTNVIKELTVIKRKRPKVLLIVPAFNEEESINKTVKTIIKNKYDYVIINDGSTDKTEEICIKNKYNIISLPVNLGIGGAVQTGYKYALNNGYDIAVQFDGDGQHDINYVNDLIQPIINNEVHFTIGSRFIENIGEQFESTKMRRFGIKIISFFIYIFSHVKIYDTTSGFRAANIDIIRKFSDDYPSEYPEPVSMFELIKQEYKVKEVPVKMHERQGGKTSIRSWKNVYYMFNVIVSIIVVQIRGDK